MGSPLRSRSAGFSLVETMVVLVVFGIMLAVAIPNIAESNRRRRAEAAANEFASRAQIARQRTIASRTPYRLVLNAGARSYRTERSTSDSTWEADPDLVFTLPDGVGWSFTAGGSAANADVEFRGDGTLQAEDAPLLVTMVGSAADSFIVSLVRTGRLTVRPGSP